MRKMIAAIARDFLRSLFGCGWIPELGQVFMDGRWQGYSAWRERSLFRGRIYRIESNYTWRIMFESTLPDVTPEQTASFMASPSQPEPPSDPIR